MCVGGCVYVVLNLGIFVHVCACEPVCILSALCVCIWVCTCFCVKYVHVSMYVCACMCVHICLCEMVQHQGSEWGSKPACPGAVLKVTFHLQLLQNYWLYSPCCTIHPWANLITPNSLYLPLTHPHIAPHSSTSNHNFKQPNTHVFRIPKGKGGQKNSLRNNGQDFSGRPAVKHCLPMQGTQVWSLIWEDSTCQVTTKPLSCNHWAQKP